MYPPFPIPSGTTSLCHSCLHFHTEDELVQNLTERPSPKSSEKNIWAYWHTGFSSMPSWLKRNVLDWARIMGREWTIRVLDSVPQSPNNVRCFVPSQFLPKAMVDYNMEGPYAATHSADFTRLALLLRYGGCWLDVGIILVRSLDEIWGRLADTRQPYEFAAFSFELRPGETFVTNAWLMARKGCELVRRWLDVFLYVWGHETRCDGLSKHPLLQHIPPYNAATDDMAIKKDFEVNTRSDKLLDYGVQNHCLERLCDMVDKDDGWNGRHWIDTKAYLLPAINEMFDYQVRTGFLGSRQFELFSTRYDASEPDRTEAESFVQAILTDSLMLKFCHGPKGALVSTLSDIWDDPENEGADCAKGTFAEYLRWGTVHLRQTRLLKPIKLKRRGGIHHVSMYEPFPTRQTDDCESGNTVMEQLLP